MNRGELYRVTHPSAHDPKKYRVFVIVSRQTLIDSRFSSVIWRLSTPHTTGWRPKYLSAQMRA